MTLISDYFSYYSHLLQLLRLVYGSGRHSGEAFFVRSLRFGVRMAEGFQDDDLRCSLLSVWGC